MCELQVQVCVGALTGSARRRVDAGRRRHDGRRVVEQVGELVLPGQPQRVEQQRERRPAAAVDAAQQRDVLARRRRRLALGQLGVEPADGAVLDQVGEQVRVAAEKLDRLAPRRQRVRPPRRRRRRRRTDVRRRRAPRGRRVASMRRDIVLTTHFIACSRHCTQHNPTLLAATALRLVTLCDRGVKYCDERVCLSVCLCVCLSVRDHIPGTTYMSDLWMTSF